MTFRLTFEGNQVGKQYSTVMAGHSKRHRAALVAAANGAMNEMLLRGRADISNAGNFGSRWTKGLKGRVTQGGGNIRIALTHDIPYWTTHQFGATIMAKSGSLLWIPLSFADDAQGVRARDFPHPLVRVDRKNGGRPLLLDTVDKQPKYFGIASVKIPKRFHLIEIAREVAKKIPKLFSTAVKGHF